MATVLLTLAAWDFVRPMVARDSSDEGRAKAVKRVSLKARLNKGSLLAPSQALNATKETWDKARRNKTRNRVGTKKRGSSVLVSQGRKSHANSSRKVCGAFVEKKGAAQVAEGSWATPSSV